MKIFLLFTLTCYILTRIVEIDGDNYEWLLKRDKYAWLIMVSNPRCGHCQEFFPIFEKTANRRDDLKFGIINTDKKSGLDLAVAMQLVGDNLPILALYSENDRYIRLSTGEVITEKEFDFLIWESTKGLKKDSNYYLKNEPYNYDDDEF
jgi:thiol-disulfide isomerase/thioredoxin